MSEDLVRPEESTFSEIARLIQASRSQAYQAVNRELIELYWEVGKRLSQQIQRAGWGKSVILELANYLKKENPGLKGFSAQNLWRMRQFHDAYSGNEKLSAVLRELPWTHNLLIINQAQSPEEREFYLRMAVREKWSSRELERQFRLRSFERAILNPPIVAPAVRQIHPKAAEHFKDSYMLEFLNLPEAHSEKDLHRGLLDNLRKFLAELGRDFCFIGSEHPIQVGRQDFLLDLLFFHRELNCLVAVELKVGRFEPEYLGKLNFYLEALDRDIRKPHENPSIGLLLCASKDDEVVEYALGRSLSATLIAEYKTKLPDKALLQAKLHEFLEASSFNTEPDSDL